MIISIGSRINILSGYLDIEISKNFLIYPRNIILWLRQKVCNIYSWNWVQKVCILVLKHWRYSYIHVHHWLFGQLLNNRESFIFFGRSIIYIFILTEIYDLWKNGEVKAYIYPIDKLQYRCRPRCRLWLIYNKCVHNNPVCVCVCVCVPHSPVLRTWKFRLNPSLSN